MANFDYSTLNNFLSNEPDNIQVIEEWYQTLLELEPDDDEKTENLKLLTKVLKWLMKYEHTAAQEIKNLAVKEATNAADVEKRLRKQNNTLLDEISSLRQKLISSSESTDFGEAFRSENEGLREENVYLKNQVLEKERDIIMQQDRIEEHRSRLEQLEKERIELITKQTHMENVVEEMSRRLESDAEASLKTEAETRKLKRRSEQAAKLSVQLQEIAKQNDTLTDEVERLSTALTSATEFIEEITVKYQNVQEELKESNALMEKLIAENAALNKQEIVVQKDVQIEEFRKKLRELQDEIDLQETRYELENTKAKEEELERLKTELIIATNQARKLFGGNQQIQSNSDAKAQAESVHLNKRIEALETKLSEKMNENNELLRSNEKKDVENARIYADLKQLRKRAFGGAENEITRLEKQIKFRDEQIEKLTTKCSLLQIEFETLNESQTESKAVTDDSNAKREQDQDQQLSSYQVEQDDRQAAPTIKDVVGRNDVSDAETTTESQIVQLSSIEANSMIIAALNNELMQLLQELNDKEKQINSITKLLERSAKETAEIKKKVEALPKTDSKKETQAFEERNMDKIAEMEIAVTEYKKFMNTIRENGSDLEKHYEAVHRNLIAEKITHSQLERKVQVLQRLRDDDKLEHEKLKQRFDDTEEFNNRQHLRSRYEMASDLMTIEIARLQNIILHSVPQKEYDKLANTVKGMLKNAITPNSQFIKDTKLEEDNTLGLQLLVNVTSDKPSLDELQAKIDYLENALTMSTNQNDYWKEQHRQVQKENDEMKKLLEDLESESQLTSLVASMERRFIDELRQERAQKQEKVPNMALFITKTDFERQKRRWNNERKSFVNIITKLKNKIQADVVNRWEGITLQEMTELQKKIEEVNEMEKAKKLELNQIMEEKDAIQNELIKVQTERQSFVEITKNDCDMIKIQKTLQAAFLNTAVLNAEIAKNEKLIEDLQQKNQSLTSQVAELLMENNFIADIETLIQKVGGDEVQKTKLETITEASSNSKGENVIDDETYVGGSSTKLTIQYPSITKTVVYDNWDECQKQIKHIRDTAEICIQNYKTQLSNKEKAIERYKQLLESYEERSVSNNISITTTSASAKDEMKRKFRKSDEILDNNELQTLKNDLIRAKIKIEELEKLNERIMEDASQEPQLKLRCTERGVQTEENGKQQVDGNESRSLKVSSTETESTKRNYTKDVSDDKDPYWMNDKEENTEKYLELDRERAENAFLKTQNRHLQQKIRELSYKNKELERLCEELRNDAMTTIEHKFKPVDEDGNKYEIVRLTEQIEELKKKLSRQTKILKQQREIIENKEDKSKTTTSRTSEEDIVWWTEKKSLQKTVLNLKKRINAQMDGNNELQKKLDRYENLNNTLQKECENYSKSQKILLAAGEQMRKEMINIESANVLLEDKLADAETAISALTEKIRVMEEENNDVKIPLTQTVHTIYAEYTDNYLKLKDKFDNTEDSNDYALLAVLTEKLKNKDRLIEEQQKTIALLKEAKWRKDY